MGTRHNFVSSRKSKIGLTMDNRSTIPIYASTHTSTNCKSEDISFSSSCEENSDSSDFATETEVTSVDERKEILWLARKEIAWMRRMRVVVIVILAVAGACLATFTNGILQKEDKDDYIDAVREFVTVRLFVTPIFCASDPYHSFPFLQQPCKISPNLGWESSTTQQAQ